VRLQTFAALAGLAVGFFAAAPYSLGILCCALPAYILWVCIVEGPDHPDVAPGNWRRIMEEAEILRAQNGIRPGPARAGRRGR
jgi:hypothetical protein